VFYDSFTEYSQKLPLFLGQCRAGLIIQNTQATEVLSPRSEEHHPGAVHRLRAGLKETGLRFSAGALAQRNETLRVARASAPGDVFTNQGEEPDGRGANGACQRCEI